MADGIGDTYLSATPTEQTNEYQDLFRQEHRQRRVTYFFGVVPPNKTQFLSTYLGEAKGPAPLHALLMSGSRPDLEMSTPNFGKPGPSVFSRLKGAGDAVKSLRSLLDKPMDLPLQMKMIFPGGEKSMIYSSNMTVGYELSMSGLIMMLTSIWLTNPNPINSGIFSFSVFFHADSTS